MNFNKNSLILLFAVLFYSCQKEIDEFDMKTDDPRLIKIKIGDLPFYEYSYALADEVIEINSTYNFINYSYNKLAQIVTVDYYSNFALLSGDKNERENISINKGLLDIHDSERGGVLRYEYDNSGKLKNSHFSLPSASSREHSEFTYDESGQIIRQTLFWDNKIAGHIDYLYDSGGNLIKESMYSITSDGIPELNTTTQYEFDNYINPFKPINKLLIPGINTNTNNIVKETFTIHFSPGQGTDIVKTTVNFYEYNSRGYPVKKNGNIEYLYE